MSVVAFFYSINESSGDCDDAVLLLIGFPNSGKSETGNTLIGKRVFKSEQKSLSQKKHQEAKSVLSDLHVTVRDMPSFESLTEFVKNLPLFNRFRN